MTWTRTQLWQRQVPATVVPGPNGGALVYLETGQTVTFPDAAAVGWFLAGWEASERAAAPEPVATEETVGETDEE